MSFLKTMINSIARTFGRILAYALIGMAIYFIASKVNAQPQYRTSTGSWGNWTDLTLENNYQFATNTSTSWSSYIQLKDTVAFDNNKTYNLYATFEVKLTQSGTREIFSAIDSYIFNGSTLTSVSDKCTISGTRSDKTTSSPLITTTHTYKGSINCVGLKNQGYYPYLTFRFYSTVAVPTAFQFKIDRWEYHVGSDSTDANNIMNNANQNTQQIIESYNEATQNIIQNNIDIANNLVETIENQNKVCNNNFVYRFTRENCITENKYLSDLGTEVNNNLSSISDFFRVDEFQTVIVQNPTVMVSAAFCFYKEDKTLISCEKYNNRSEITVMPPNDTFWMKTSVFGDSVVTITTTYCYDYREKETETQDEIKNNLKNFLNIFSDDSTPSSSDIETSLNGINLPSDTPMTNLLMFPILVFSFFSNSMSSSCSPVVLGTLYGYELSLPCLNVANYLGLTLWNIIDLLAMFYMIYNIAHLLIGIFEDISELRSPFLRFFIKNRGVINND